MEAMQPRVRAEGVLAEILLQCLQAKGFQKTQEVTDERIEITLMKRWMAILIGGAIYGIAFTYFGYWVGIPMVAIQFLNVFEINE